VSLLEVTGLVSGYGEMEILHGVSLHVEAGEIVTIIGPNGSGKSTLMKTIFGLLKPREGQVLFDGLELTGLPPHRIVQKGLCYVPQSSNTFLTLTVQENLEMGAFIRKDDYSARLEQVYGLFPDLKAQRNAKVAKLSGGQRQMVAIARALMLDPKLLLLDEPSAGLSPIFVQSIFQQIVEINRQGVTVLMVEQNAQRALEHSTRGYVMASGEVRLEGTSRTILANEEIARLYLGR
jgi:ABC-type branched-subunit amino acid transport system ATPase component